MERVEIPPRNSFSFALTALKRLDDFLSVFSNLQPC